MAQNAKREFMAIQLEKRLVVLKLRLRFPFRSPPCGGSLHFKRSLRAPHDSTFSKLNRYSSQSGGGKIGCLFNLLILAAIAAIGIKVFPVYYSNNQFVNAIGDITSKAASLNQETIHAQILAKAMEYKISEALAPGALTVSRVSSRDGGTCMVKINYSREVNLYGIITIKMTTDKEIARPFIFT